jgi:hypothetical protein
VNSKERGRKGSSPNLRYYPRISLEELRKITDSPSILYSGRVLNWPRPEYKSIGVTIHAVFCFDVEDGVIRALGNPGVLHLLWERGCIVED